MWLVVVEFMIVPLCDVLLLATWVSGEGWSEDAVQLLDSLTLCATWRVIMVKIESRQEDKPGVKIVDTTTERVSHEYS